MNVLQHLIDKMSPLFIQLHYIILKYECNCCTKNVFDIQTLNNQKQAKLFMICKVA